MINFGILFPYVLGYFTSVKTFNIVIGSIPLFYSIAFLNMPESPIYLISKEKYDKTETTMLHLRGKNSDYKSEIKSLREEMNTEKKSFRDLLKIKAVKKALTIILIQFFCFQMSGANAVTFYNQQIFIDAAISVETKLATIIIASFQVTTAVISVKCINMFGRKKMLCTFNVFLVLSLIALGYYFTLKDRDAASAQHLRWLPLLAVCVYLVTFSLGMAPVS